MDGALVELTDVSAGYGGQKVLRGISFSVAEGSLVTVIGPNGHGKSTLLRCISGLVTLTSGSISFDGTSLQNFKAHQIVDRGIIHVPQGDMIFPDMTVLDNLLMGAYLPSASAKAKGRLNDIFQILPVLAERRHQISSTLSGGERRMLGIGRGLMSGGRILMIDEPSLGLAPIVIEEIYKVITDLKQQGRTILLVEENASRVMELADRIMLLDQGSIVWQGTPADLVDHAELIETYLGG